MRKMLKIKSKNIGEVLIQLLEDKNPKTASAIYNALPFKSKANVWGEEIYFPIPVKVDLENSQVVVNVGDVAYWPPENCMCIFFGKTPASIGDEIRAYSPVNVFGQVLGNPKVFSKVKPGEEIFVEKA